MACNYETELYKSIRQRQKNDCCKIRYIYEYVAWNHFQYLCWQYLLRALWFGVFQRVRFLVEWGLGGPGVCSPEKFWTLHFSNCWKYTNFLKDGHLGLLWRHSERQFSKINLRNSRVTYQKSVNAWEMLTSVGVRVWDYIEVHDTHAQCTRLESSD